MHPVCVHRADAFSSALTGYKEPDLIVSQNFGIQEGFIVRKDAVKHKRNGNFRKTVLDFGKEINKSQHDFSEWKEKDTMKLGMGEMMG